MVETHTGVGIGGGGVGIGGEGGGEVRAVYKTHTTRNKHSQKEVTNEEEGKAGRPWCACTHRSRR